MSEFVCIEEEFEEDLCDYTGEECFGNKLFCEECCVFISKDNDVQRAFPDLEQWRAFWNMVEGKVVLKRKQPT